VWSSIERKREAVSVTDCGEQTTGQTFKKVSIKLSILNYELLHDVLFKILFKFFKSFFVT